MNVFLSVKLNQDPLEKFFGCIRQHGRVNDNPTVLQAMKSTQTLRVINSIRFATITGNCRGSNKRKEVEIEDVDVQLPKKKAQTEAKIDINHYS